MVTVILILLTAYLVLGIIYFGAKRDRYSHIRHTISELGEKGSISQRAVNYALFLPVGAGLILIVPQAVSNEAIGGLSFCLGTGYLVAALFPCDKGSPINGSWRQHIHNLGGFVEYAGGAYFLLQAHGTIYSVASSAVFIGMIAISFPQNPVRGLIQRIIELLLFGGLIHLSTTYTLIK